jgi:hypothetical protein
MQIFVQYLEKKITDEQITPLSCLVGSLMVFVPKPNRKGLRFCVDYSHFNDYTKNDETLFPIMNELSRKIGN